MAKQHRPRQSAASQGPRKGSREHGAQDLREQASEERNEDALDNDGLHELDSEELHELDRDLSLDPEREFQDEVSLYESGRTEPLLGPSDSSDMASEVPASVSDANSDRSRTGERAQVEPWEEDPTAEDILPDKTVPDDSAGLSHTPPDPERNGGIEER